MGQFVGVRGRNAGQINGGLQPRKPPAWWLAAPKPLHGGLHPPHPLLVGVGLIGGMMNCFEY